MDFGAALRHEKGILAARSIGRKCVSLIEIKVIQKANKR